jgi:polar amino acid transport system substrate-binding protein
MRALVVLAVVLTLALAASAHGESPPTVTPAVLTVGVSLPSEGFEVGIVKGTQVLYAQGFDIDLARALAGRLGLSSVQFVQTRFDTLFSGGPKAWDVAVAQITITPQRAQRIDFTRAYLSADQGVLVAQTVKPVPSTLAGLRPLRICALRKSTGADQAQTRIAPSKPVRLVGNVSTLMLNLQTGRCQAVVYDAPTLGTLKARAPDRYGPFVGVIRTGEQYGIAVPKGSALLASADAALGQLLADGTIAQLQRKWLTANVSKLPVLG